MSHAEYCKNFIPPGGRILDVGAGKGEFLREMAGFGFEAHGVETNPKYIGGRVLGGRAEKLPFQSDYFDFVNCAEVTEHVDEPKKVCAEIFRVLKPGGRCYISFHNRWGVYDYHYHLYFINWMPRAWAEKILKLLKKQKEDGQAGRQKLATMNYYTFREVKTILAEAGFNSEDIRKGKIRKRLGILSLIFLPAYFLILRPLYFNTFHFLLAKPEN